MQKLALGFQFRSARYFLFTNGEIQQYELCIKGKKNDVFSYIFIKYNSTKKNQGK